LLRYANKSNFAKQIYKILKPHSHEQNAIIY
jgi:hypothetical protein